MENQIVLSMTSVLTIIGGFGVIFTFFYKLLVKKFDKIDMDIKDIKSEVKEVGHCLTSLEKSTEHRFGKVETRLSVIETELKNTNQRLTDFQVQMNQHFSIIEGYLIPKKVFHLEKPHEEEPKEN